MAMEILETKRRGRKGREIPADDLPNQARPLRLEKKWTLSQTAERIRTDVNSLSEFELTGRGLGRELQWALAEVLGVDFPTLVTPGKKFAEKVRQSLDIIR